MSVPLLRAVGAVLLATFPAFFPPLADAQHFPADDDLELMLRYLVEDGPSTGIVLGVLEADGTTRVVAYGDPGPGARPLEPRSGFEIASITKSFTATLLADMALRGEVGLDDPVSRYLPEEVTVPSWNGREITLRHLATHTSGLPAGPDDYAAPDPLDPYADYTVEMGYEFLSSHRLRYPPGDRWEYSNLGYGLLGHALSRAAGTPFPKLLRERVLDPLGMESTGFAIEGRAEAWMTRGHARGRVVPYWSAPESIQGAGGLRSSAEDMVKFLRANLAAAKTDLEHAMRLTHEIQVPAGAEGDGQGLAWRTVAIPGQPPLVTHGGTSGGFRTQVAFIPERGIGVVLLTNAQSFRDPLPRALLYTGAPPAEWRPVDVDPDVLEGYVGEYRSDAGVGRYNVRLDEEGYLTYQPAGQVRARLYATSDTAFYVLRSPWSITFRRREDGGVTEMRMDPDVRAGEEAMGRGGITARRVRDRAPDHPGQPRARPRTPR